MGESPSARTERELADLRRKIEAYIPRSYVPDMRLKIDLYRRIARLSTIATVPTNS